MGCSNSTLFDARLGKTVAARFESLWLESTGTTGIVNFGKGLGMGMGGQKFPHMRITSSRGSIEKYVANKTNEVTRPESLSVALLPERYVQHLMFSTWAHNCRQLGIRCRFPWPPLE
jgi:hypothetical protein